jgi:hypothetical protein
MPERDLSLRALSPGHSVGYYGVPGGRGTKVHVHRTGEGPICGVRLAPDSRYQWCARDAVGYVECGRFLAMLRRAGLCSPPTRARARRRAAGSLGRCSWPPPGR